MKTLFEAIGYRLGRKAAQARNLFDLLGGDDEESLRAEIRLGRDMAGALLGRTCRVEENENTKFAQQILHWLAPHVIGKKLPFLLFITADSAPNALALPGGPIFVSWPLLELCQGQRDEVAFLLGHEMGHIIRRDPLDRIVKDAALSLVLQQSAGGSATKGWLSKTATQMLSRGFSRDQELAADPFAWYLVKAAGGDALQAESFLQKLAAANSGRSLQTGTEFFAAHPPVSDRIANLRATNPS